MAARAKKDNTAQLFGKLEQIVEKLENDDVDIDNALNLYREGVELATDLNTKLTEISKEIYVLKEKLDGSFALSNFEESQDEEEYDD